MTTIFLRSDTEQPLRDALLASGLAFEHEGELLPQGDVVILGTIYRQTGMDGDEPVYEALDGWHVNMLGDVPQELQPFVIPEPGNPYCVFWE